ncbi:MAG: Undecaprenyl-diphosphatase BcrC [Pelotomaculum sp. PtaB.Bin013]|uniref:Phosphatase PAP2 family protein n=1 Tax=Pelotomaculum isophthalicicum JI TaxID=947010 RepID=A0A9X4H6Y2_9FIRM|nr:phosphatase PAP2 family protein [Pelotomaculum isophthalicicum]MDF9408894.1 phosphatase PAP2 family protein [Pelotomaculum isophthalicicum JI]OPX86072.1 MAG: Undecaprenyl-diphosphatase BcrC [Pelotomaculum sp. PtaB.Bin013]
MNLDYEIFPSDHATGATAVTASIFGKNKRWGTILTVMSLALVFSRVYCGTHYPLDILGGMVTGLIGSFMANRLWLYMDGIAGKLVTIWAHLIDKSTGA